MQKVSAHTRVTGAASDASGPEAQEDSASVRTRSPVVTLFMATGYVGYGFQLSAQACPVRWQPTYDTQGARVRIAIGSDHAGFEMKQHLIKHLEDTGHSVTDVGTDSTEPVDYPDFAAAVAREVVHGQSERGIVVCGSGAGASIAANKITGARSAVVHDHYTAHQAVEHDDMNVLALGSRVIGETTATEIVDAYIGAKFSNEERHARRLRKVVELDRNRG
jgi:ribose 5-phosphate isomerase B